MSNDLEDILAFMAFSVVIIVVFGTVAASFDFASCRSRASGLQLESTWGPMQGCLVTRRDGVIVAIDNYGRSDAK